MSQRCSACLEPGHNRLLCPRVYSCKAPAKALRRHSETHAIRDAVWEQLSFRFPIPAKQLFDRVESDWGEIGERRLWRALLWNQQRRRVRRVEYAGYVKVAA